MHDSTANLTWINPRFRAFWASPAAAFAVPLGQGEVAAQTVQKMSEAGVLIAMLFFFVVLVIVFGRAWNAWVKVRLATLEAEKNEPPDVNEGLVDVLKDTTSGLKTINAELKSMHEDNERWRQEVKDERKREAEAKEGHSKSFGDMKSAVDEAVTESKKRAEEMHDEHVTALDGVKETLSALQDEVTPIRASLGDLEKPDAQTIRQMLMHLPRILQLLEQLRDIVQPPATTPEAPADPTGSANVNLVTSPEVESKGA